MKVLVHLHIYYYDQMIYFLYKLSNISGCDWELFITEARHDPEIEKVFCRLGTRVHYIETGNRGYDIWPFIKVMKSVDLDEYDLVMKLHTKNRRNGYEKINGVKLSGYQWRNELVDSLLKNKKHFRWLMDTFRKNDRLGLMCSDWMYKKISKSLPEDATMLDAELERLGFKINNENFMLVGHMEDAPCQVEARADIYGMTDNFGQHTFVTDADGQMYRRIMSNNSLGGAFETTPLTLDNKGYSINQFGLLRQQFVNQPCWDELNRRFVYITTYNSGASMDSPFGPIATGEQYKLSKLVAPAPQVGTEEAIAQKCAPVWDMPEGTEILAMMYATQSGNPFTGYNDLWSVIYNDATGNTYLTEFLINSNGQIIDGADLKNIPFPGGNLTKESLFMETGNKWEYFYNKMNFLVYSKGNEIRWLDRKNDFQDNAYITLPNAGDKVTYMGWAAWANYGALIVGTEQGMLYIYEATISNAGASGTNPLLPNPKILAEFDLGGKIVSAKEFDNERTSYAKEKY